MTGLDAIDRKDRLASAYRQAREGRRLLDRGETEATRKLLTETMERNVAEALRAARELLAALSAPTTEAAPLPVG